MPLRTVRSPKALWYVVCGVLSRLFLRIRWLSFKGVALGVLVRGVVPKVPVVLLLASFNLRTGSLFREGLWKVISLPFVLSRDRRLFSYNPVIWLLVRG